MTDKIISVEISYIYIHLYRNCPDLLSGNLICNKGMDRTISMHEVGFISETYNSVMLH